MEQNKEQELLNPLQNHWQAPSPPLLFPYSITKILPPSVKTELESMPIEKQSAFLLRFNQRAKTQGMAIILFIFGFHYLYFEKWGLQIIYWLTGAGLGFWGLYDMFRLSNMVDQYNKNLARELLADIKIYL
jgi:hypothetical protein